MNIYVSNLGFTVMAEDLKKLFLPYGVVGSVSIILDKFTNRSRGFAFVEMPETLHAEKAIQELNGVSLEGRSLRVNEANPQEDKKSRKSFY